MVGHRKRFTNTGFLIYLNGSYTPPWKRKYNIRLARYTFYGLKVQMMYISLQNKKYLPSVHFNKQPSNISNNVKI